MAGCCKSSQVDLQRLAKPKMPPCRTSLIGPVCGVVFVPVFARINVSVRGFDQDGRYPCKDAVVGFSRFKLLRLLDQPAVAKPARDRRFDARQCRSLREMSASASAMNVGITAVRSLRFKNSAIAAFSSL